MAKMVMCKACGKEIAKSAKACPNCGAKNKKRVGCLAAMCFLVAFVAFAAASGSNEPVKVENNTPTGEAVQSATTANDTVFTVGDTAVMDDVYVTFVGIEEYKGDEFMHPEDGNIYVSCEFLIENKSGSTLTVSSLLCFEAYFDDFSASFSLGAQTASDLGQLDGEIAAGKKMSGAICYEVPKDWTTAEIRFNPDFGYNEFVFTYSK